MNNLIKNAGCLIPFVKLTLMLDQKHVAELINYGNATKGFLCNYQIPFMYVFSSSMRGNMAEVGCWYGRTTSIIRLANTKINLYCVDPFTGSEEHQKELNGYKFRQDFEDNLKQRGFSVNVVEKYSKDASVDFPDEFFDAIWIDAAHDYKNVCLDINSWYPKLKRGGYLLGHDYPEPNDLNGGFEELTRAVNENVKNSDKFTDFGWFCGIWAAIKC